MTSPTDTSHTTFRPIFICFLTFLLISGGGRRLGILGTFFGGSGAMLSEADDILMFEISHFTPFLISFLPLLTS